MEILGAVALVAVAGGLIVWPLLRGSDHQPRGAPAEPEQDRAKAAALAAIRELEFDFQTGKISAEDYAVLRARYETKAVDAMTAPQPARDLDREIEAQVASLRALRRCGACGEALPAAANFCPACGAVASGARR